MRVRTEKAARAGGALATVAILACHVLGSAAAAESVSVTIDTIVSNDCIAGRVHGLTSTGRASYRVVVYIKTDRYYLHPFTHGAEGESYASISEEDGSWSIQTVRRDIAATAIGVVVVPIGSPTPDSVDNVRSLDHIAVLVRDLRGTADYGKL